MYVTGCLAYFIHESENCRICVLCNQIAQTGRSATWRGDKRDQNW